MPDLEPMPTAMSPQEKTAREYLAQGRFRKARDEFKVLCKIDREKFLPLLIEANVGLARAMLNQGLVADAQQVVSYLRTIAPPEAVLALQLDIGMAANALNKGSGIQNRPELEDFLEAIAKTTGTPDERSRLADGAVLMFEPAASLRAELAGPAIELEAVGSALRATSERQFDRALDLVRPLGQSSAFSHWKAFIKGLAAFHSGEKEKAARFFAGLPATSAPGKAAQSYLLLLGAARATPNSLPLPAVLEGACRLAGEPGCGQTLLRAEQEWRKGNAADMYLSLRNGIRRFPSEGVDFLGVLSEFSVNCYFTLAEGAEDVYLDRVAAPIVDRRGAKGPLEESLLLRTAILTTPQGVPDSMVLSDMERYLRLREKLHGADGSFDSMAYGWLGNIMSERQSPDVSPFGRPLARNSDMRNPKEAQRLLEKALALDGSNLSASLKLCEVYQRKGLNAERNRLLDLMAVKFSQDKKVLVLVAESCLDRKAPKKGLDYLYQALQVDRLDQNIPDLVVKAWLLQAREQFQKGKPDLARKSLDGAAGFERTTPGNLYRSGWCLKIQRGLMEAVWGDPPRGGALLEEARRESPSEAAFLYYAGFTGLQIGRDARKLKTDYFKELARLLKREANAADAVLLTRIWPHGTSLIPREKTSETKWLLQDYLRSASKRPFTREDASRLVEFGLAVESFEETAMDFVKARLREDARDPVFRLYNLQLNEWRSTPGCEKERGELEGILAEAILRKDDPSIRRARQKLDAIRLSPPLPPPSFDPVSDESSGFGVPGPLIDALLDGLPSTHRKLMEKLIFVMANGSDAEIRELKRTRPPGMSDQDFDVMLDLVRETSSFGMPDFGPDQPPAPKPKLKSAPVPHPPRPRDISNPDQPELF